MPRVTRTVQRSARERADAFVGSRLRRVGVALVCAAAAGLPLVFDYSLDVPFTVPKALLMHALAFALTGIMVALVIRLGPSAFPRSWLHTPVLVFGVVALAASVFAADRTLAVYGTHVRMLGLGTIASWLVLYFAVASLIRTRSDVRVVIGALLTGAAGAVTYEIIQLAGRDPLRWTLDGAARPFSTIGQPTTLALYLICLALGVMSLAVFAEGVSGRLRALGLAASAAMIVGAAATGTRSAVVGMGAGTAMLIVLVWLVHPGRRARMLAAAGAALSIAALGGLLFWTPVGARVAVVLEAAGAGAPDEDVLSRLEPSLAGRVALYQIAAQEVAERPILGYGPDNFVVGVPTYRSESEPREIQQSLPTSAHSWVAYVAASTGVLGLVTFVSIAGSAFALAIRGGYRPLALAAAVALAAYLGTGLTTVNDVATDWLFWFFSGAIVATTAARTDAPPDAHARGARGARREPRRSGTRSLAAASAVAVALALSATAVGAWSASRAARDSANLRLIGNVPQAIERGEAATRSDPGRAEYWHVLGLAYVAATRWTDASAAFERARSLAPHDVRHLGDWARAQLVLAGGGDTAAGRRAAALAADAVRVDPNNPLAQLTNALVMQSTGRGPEALQAIERALALDPRSTNDALWLTAVQVNRAAGRPGEAIRIAREGLSVFGATRRTIPLRVELARALVQAERVGEALSELDAALTIAPNQASIVQLRAQFANAAPR